MFAFCLGFIDGDGIRVDVYRLDEGDESRLYAIDVLQKLFDDLSIEKIGHNIKFDLKFAEALGIIIPPGTIIHDTMIISQILNNLAPGHGLKDLAWRFRGISRDTEKTVKRIAQARGGYHRVPKHIMEKYQKEDGENPMLLFLMWLPQLKKDPVLWKDYRNEMDLILETIRMETYGMRLDLHKCKEMVEWMEDELNTISINCLEMFGEIPNVNSGPQLNHILYTKLKLPVLKETEGGAASTGKDTIALLREKHPHPFLDMVLKQRSYTKGISMINGYIEHADSKQIIHPNIKTNEARTGRQSVERPNLQNVSKALSLKNSFPVPLRKVLCCHPDHVMLLVDYSSIELRLIIDRAAEQSLIDLLKSGGDPHNEGGAIWFGDYVRPELRWSLRPDKASRKTLRDAGKNATFGKAYGASLPKLATTLGLTIEEITPGYREFCKRWPKVANYTATSARRVLDNGYVVTAFGRKLYVNKDKAYMGANYDIQGTAAGILKRAQVRVGKFLRENYPEVRIMLPVHDELIFSYPKKLLDQRSIVLAEISRLMTTMDEIQAPLEVEWKMSETTWADAKELTI
jgi:DNA polymerase-1